MIALVILSWLAIQTTPVQNWLVHRITNKLSKDLHTTVSIKHVDFSLFNKMLLEETIINDHQKDTLLYAGVLKLNITDWFFLKDSVDLKYIGLQDAVINLKRSDSIWNYQFLVDYFSSSDTSRSRNKSSVTLNLKNIEFENVRLLQQDGWRGEDQVASFDKLSLDADKISFPTKQARINSLALTKPFFSLYNYKGNRPESLKTKDSVITYKNDPEHLRWNKDGWDIEVKELALDDGTFKNDRQTARPPDPTFDGAHILFSNINGKFENLVFRKDTLTTALTLSTKERSGFEVKKMKANMKWYPEAMEFANLDIQTNHSHIQKYFAMRYNTFDDMGSFISKVRMEADLTGADINSDDIAYFAPELANWKKDIHITGKIKGPVENLVGRKLVVQAGKDTYLNGNIILKGLPDIDKTFIDFEANEFRTTYADAIRLIPSLKNIHQFQFDQLQYLHFNGNFTGFMNDFVTYGTIETNLGIITSDMNMKLSPNGLTGYSGNIKTNTFNLGKLMDIPELGMISFEGEINGTGIKANNLNAKLDGNIQSLEWNGYTYHDINVKGDIAKRLFNGDLTVNDPNLNAHLIGLIDLSKQIPEFNFDADITKADLKNIKLIKDSVSFTGKVKTNFTGDNIDNFLGTARIFDATILKNGKRISFDSLSLESKAMDNNKVITAVSNEFDAALVGEFSIRDLPDAFRSFLGKYYPSYIKPSTGILENENFSFVITTKKVDEYLDFVDHNLGGFNYSTVTGRINSKENLLDLNAEIPQFSYKSIFFYNVNLKGTGNRDSLSLQSNIADVYINDSLHFPGTSIHVNSSNDVSLANIKTAANQALNSANLSAKVLTQRDGVRVTFNESHFDLNGSDWTISKNGELALSKNFVSADGVRIYNGQQEILVTTQPSDIGNTNDIKVNLKKVNIGDFAPYFVTSNRFEGMLSGTVSIMDPYGKLQVDLIGTADQFRLDNDSIGKLELNANYDLSTGKVNFATVSQNQHYNFDLKGLYNTLDTTSAKQLDITTNFNNTEIRLLDKYLSGVFSNLEGTATGQLHIVGPPKKLKYLGKVQLNDGKLRVNYTNVEYTIPSANFDFKDGYIDFGSFAIKDEFGHTGTLTKGILKHEGFDNLKFDFALNTNKLLVLSTNSTSKEPYYGTVFAKANMTFTGPLSDMQMDIAGEPADSSKIYIRSESGHESTQYDYIVWKVYGREMTPVKSDNESNLSVNLDITANNYANVYVILDELTGDIIQATGTGHIAMRASADGEFTINGRYNIDRGNYNFNFQSLLHKPFVLREGAGNYIQWTGDPYDAKINIDAEYIATQVRFSDLGDQSTLQASGGASDGSNNVRKYRGDVIVIAKLTDKLMQPTIKFRIELPPGSQLRNDPYAQGLLAHIENDENELNKQVAFLIVFDSFGPLSTSQSQGNLGSTAFQGVVVNSISGVLSSTLSKQFSNIFQKIFKDKSIRVNFNAQLYNGSNLVDNANNRLNIDRTNLNFSLAESFLNERLTFTFGSALDFGLSPQQVQATKNLQFLPDITAEWKVRQDGKVVLSFFYRDSYNYLTGVPGRENRSGTSISYRRDFDRISDLWKSDKKKKIRINLPSDSTSTTIKQDSTGSN